MKKAFLTLGLVALLPLKMHATSHELNVFGTWLTQAQSDAQGAHRSKVKIDRCKHNKNQLCGSIIWLENPIDSETHKAKLDKHNPKEDLQKRPLIGLEILEGFVKDKSNANIYEGGTIYNPREGKTYKCKLTVEGDVLKVRGYIGIPLLGQTKVWTRDTK